MPFLFGQGHVETDLTVEVNLRPTHVADPWSLAPDAWFGVTDQLTLGVITSGPAIDRFEPAPDYRHIGVDGLWKLGDDVAARARFLMREMEPDKPAVTLGALVRWGHFFVADPYVQFGLENQARGNRAQIFLPVTVTVEPICGWAIDLRTGFDSDVALLDDGGWYIPMYVGTRVRVDPHVEVGAAVGFFSAIGPQNNGDNRTLFVTTRWLP